jgi:hypothetical protein
MVVKRGKNIAEKSIYPAGIPTHFQNTCKINAFSDFSKNSVKQW